MAFKISAHEERIYFCLNALRLGSLMKDWGYIDTDKNRDQTRFVGADLSMSGAACVAIEEDGSLIEVRTTSNQVVPFSKSSHAVFFDDVASGAHQMFKLASKTGVKPILCYEEVTVSKNFGGMLGTSRSQAAFLTGWGQAFREEYGEAEVTKLIAIPLVNTQIKKVFGSGSMSKQEILDYIKDTVDIHFNDDNQADAFGAALMGLTITDICIAATGIDISKYDDPKAMREELNHFGSAYVPWEPAFSVLSKPNFFNNLGLASVHEKVRKEFLQLRASIS